MNSLIKPSFLHIIKEDVTTKFDDIIYLIVENKYTHKITMFPLHNVSLLYLDDYYTAIYKICKDCSFEKIHDTYNLLNHLQRTTYLK